MSIERSETNYETKLVLATDFAKTLTQIENRQTEVAGQVQNNKALLQGVQESFANSLQEFNKTVTVLDEKIKALSKKK